MAMPTKLTLEIVTPDRALVREEVDEVHVPGSEGYLGILPGHAPLLATLGVGELWYRKGQDKVFVSIVTGFAEVLPDKVTILAQVAEKADEIDVARAEAAKTRAEERLADSKAEIDAERARIALVKAISRLQVSARVPGGGRAEEIRRMLRDQKG